MKYTPTLLTLCVVLALPGLDRAALAQTTYFPTDTTINYAVQGDAEVGRDSNLQPYSPTVNLVTGGSISGMANIYYNSIFNMSDGSIGNGLEINGNCTVNITGGIINVGVDAAFQSTVNITGGSIDPNSLGNALEAYMNSTINMNGGSSGIVTANDNSTINLRGGDPGGMVSAYDSSTINFFGTNLAATLIGQFNGINSYTLSGTLQDGTDLTDKLLNVASTASFTLNPVTITGNISLEDYPTSQVPLSFTFRPTDNSESFTQTVTPAPDGSFRVVVSSKSYTVAIQGSKWLRKVIAIDASQGNVSGVSAALLGGDANHDNSVDVLDLSLLILSFDAGPSDPHWDEGVADFNGNEVVDDEDLSILIRNFDTEGDA